MSVITQDVHGVPVKVGAPCQVRGTVQSISGIGDLAQITVAVVLTTHAGDTNGTIVVGRKQLTVQPSQ